MINLKTVAIGVVLSAQMAFAAVAGAMTIAEFKAMNGEKQNTLLSELVVNDIEGKRSTDSKLGQCLEDQFFKVSTNSLGVPDGALLVMRQIEISRDKDPHGRTVEQVVALTINHVAKVACSKTTDRAK